MKPPHQTIYPPTNLLNLILTTKYQSQKNKYQHLNFATSLDEEKKYFKLWGKFHSILPKL